jgi:ATP-dependent metalloprotease FtsH
MLKKTLLFIGFSLNNDLVPHVDFLNSLDSFIKKNTYFVSFSSLVTGAALMTLYNNIKRKKKKKLLIPDGFSIMYERGDLNALGGYTDLKKKLRDIGNNIIYDPHCLLNKINIIYGHHGTGKTTLTRFLASDLKVPIMYIEGDVLNQSKNYLSIIDALIDKTINQFKGIILIDNIETLEQKRYKYLFQKLYQIQFQKKQIMIIATSSNPYFISQEKLHNDPYITFFSINLPSLHDRKDIISVVAKHYNIARNININKIVNMTEGYSPREICELISLAEHIALERNSYTIEEQDFITAIIKTQRDNNLIFSDIQSTQNIINKYSPVDKTGITFNDVAGLSHIKSQINHIVNYLKNPSLYEERGIRIPKGILFSGESGCGKTLLAKAIAEEAGVPFISVNGSDFISMYIASGYNNMKELFKAARSHAPCIIFIDEIDSIAPQRSNKDCDSSKEYTQTLNKLLEELDGFHKDYIPIVIIGATNRIDSIDSALLRPGRMELHFEFSLPTIKEREDILKIHLKNKKYNQSISISYLAKKTVGFSGAKLEFFVNSAGIKSLEKNHDYIEMDDFIEAYEDITLGHALPEMSQEENERWLTALHEAGHLFCALKMPDSLYTFDTISIIPRAEGSLGVTHFIPKNEDITSKNRENLFADIVRILGGIAAEKYFFQTTSSGVSNDLMKATYYAKEMIYKYGMGNSLIVLDEDTKESQEEINTILNSARDKAYDIIKTYEKEILIIAQALIQKKSLLREEVETLIKHKNEDISLTR